LAPVQAVSSACMHTFHPLANQPLHTASRPTMHALAPAGRPRHGLLANRSMHGKAAGKSPPNHRTTNAGKTAVLPGGYLTGELSRRNRAPGGAYVQGRLVLVAEQPQSQRATPSYHGVAASVASPPQ
jgi:hypothetical protein